jgi:hypothetical protein
MNPNRKLAAYSIHKPKPAAVGMNPNRKLAVGRHARSPRSRSELI